MRYDLTDLRLFAQVAEAGTITGGAAASHLTLASASERIRNLEATLGVPLLVRQRRGVVPTPAGRTLLHHARLVLQQLDHLEGELGDHVSGLRGHVRLLCNSAAMSDWLPRRLGGFLAAHPGMSVDLAERRSEDIADALRSGAWDAGVVSDAADLGSLQAFPLRADPLVLVVAAGHALAARRSIAFAEVLDHALVGLAAGSALEDHLAAHARRQGRRLRYRVQLAGLDAVCRMVGQGVGPAIVPLAVARRHAAGAGIRKVALEDPWAQRSLVLCLRELQALPAPARQLVDWLLQPEAAVSRPRRARAG